MWWKLKQLCCFHKWEFFTEYDESNNKDSWHYTILQCRCCDKVKIKRNK